MLDVLYLIPSKKLSEFMSEHNITLSVMQKATIISEYADKKEKAKLFRHLLNEIEDEKERALIESAISDLKQYGQIVKATEELYLHMYPSIKFPLFPFLEICRLPVLFNVGDIIESCFEPGIPYYVAALPSEDLYGDFTDQSYMCINLTAPIKTKEDMFNAHEHLHLCEAEPFDISLLSNIQKNNLKTVIEMLKKD